MSPSKGEPICSWNSSPQAKPSTPTAFGATPKNIYSLTIFGESVMPVLNAMCKWGKAHMDEKGAIRPLSSEI